MKEFYRIKKPGYFRRYKYYQSVKKQQNDIRNFVNEKRKKAPSKTAQGFNVFLIIYNF